MKLLAHVCIIASLGLSLPAAAQGRRIPERGPEGTVAYSVKVESSESGAKVEVDGEYAGTTPCEITVYGDNDGTFHNFGNYLWTIRATPGSRGEAQTKTFRTGGFFKAEDRIPSRIFFDLGLPFTGEPAPASPTSRTTPGEMGSVAISTGTGWFITKDGYLVTCYHVVARASAIRVKIGNKLEPAELIKKDVGADLAVLKVSGEFDSLAVGESRSAKLGQRAFTVGYPRPVWQGQEAKFTDGSISSLSGFQDDSASLQFSAPVQPGNSGGALVNSLGEVIGVVNAKLRGGENVNYAIKSNRLKALLEEVASANLPQNPGQEKTPEQLAETLTKATVMVVVF